MQKANKINLLHTSFAYYPYMNMGGVPRAVYDLVRAQIDRYKITVVTNRIEDSRPDDINNVEVIYLKNLSRKMIYNYQFYTPIPQLKLISAVKMADIIHFHGHRNLLNDMVYYLSRFFRKPYIITTHGTLHNYETKRIAKKLYDLLLGNRFVNNAEYITAHSEREKIKLQESGIEKDKIVVIPNGIYFDDLNGGDNKCYFFEKYGISRDKKVILFLGKITRRKGLDVSIEAFKRIRDDNLRLVIAGEVIGKYPPHFQKDNRIKYIGHLGLSEKISAIFSSEVLLYPSLYEAFGYVPFESFFLGRPCIVGDDFGTSEHLSPVVPEIVVSYGDAIELANLIVRLINDSGFRDDIVKRGRRYIIQNYSIERAAIKFDNLYSKVLN